MNVSAFVSISGDESFYMQNIGGLPLFLRTCYNLKKVLPEDKITVCSENDTILEMAHHHDFKTTTIPGKEYIDSDISISCSPDVVFLSKSTIEKAVSLLVTQKYECVGSVPQNYLELINELNRSEENGDLIRNYLNHKWVDKTGFFALNTQWLKANPAPMTNRFTFVGLDKLEQICAETDDDLWLIRAIENGLPMNSEHKTQNLLKHFLMKKLISCKAVICDVDGVLTDGKMIFSENGDEIKNFYVKDGIAANLLKENGYKLGLLSSGRNSKLIQKRGEMLHFDVIDVDCLPKIERFHQILKKLDLSDNEVIYIGDDINDLDVMNTRCISVCPADAHSVTKNKSNWTLNSKGGQGCLREVADLLLSLNAGNR